MITINIDEFIFLVRDRYTEIQKTNNIDDLNTILHVVTHLSLKSQLMSIKLGKVDSCKLDSNRVIELEYVFEELPIFLDYLTAIHESLKKKKRITIRTNYYRDYIEKNEFGSHSTFDNHVRLLELQLKKIHHCRFWNLEHLLLLRKKVVSDTIRREYWQPALKLFYLSYVAIMNRDLKLFVMRVNNYLPFILNMPETILPRNSSARDKIFEDIVNLMLISAMSKEFGYSDTIIGSARNGIVGLQIPVSLFDLLKGDRNSIAITTKNFDCTIYTEMEITINLTELKHKEVVNVKFPIVSCEVKKFFDKTMLVGIEGTGRSVKELNPKCYFSAVMFSRAISSDFNSQTMNIDSVINLSGLSRDDFDSKIKNSKTVLKAKNVEEFFQQVLSAVSGNHSDNKVTKILL